MYSSDAHTNVYKGSIAVWRGVGKSARRGMRGGGEGMFRSRADQWRENMVATGCGIHQRRYSAYLLRSLLSSLRSLFRPPAPFLFFPLSPRSFTCVHDDRGTERGRGLCKKKKKKKLFHWELFAIKKKREPAFVGSFPNLIFHDAGEKKIFRPYLHLLSATWKRIIALLPESTVYERFWKVPRFHGYARGECIVSLKGAVSNVMSVFRQLLLFRSSGLEWLVIQHLLKFLK